MKLKPAKCKDCQFRKVSKTGENHCAKYRRAIEDINQKPEDCRFK